MKKVKVQIVKSIAGLRDPTYDLPEFDYQPGQIVELHPKLAKAWIASGTAKAVEKDPLAKLRDEVERRKLELEIKKLKAKLAVPKPERSDPGCGRIWKGGTQREFAAWIVDMWDRRERGDPNIPETIRSAPTRRQAVLQYAKGWSVLTIDGKKEKIKPDSLWRNYYQQTR